MLENTEEATKEQLYCQFLWIVLLLPLLYSLAFICPVSWVPYVASFYGFSFLVPHVREYRKDNKKGQSIETDNIGNTRHRTNKF
jgi:hypothetical protein